MNRKPKKFGKNTKTFSEKILKILSKNANVGYNYKQIAAILELNDTKSRNEIIKDLKILAAQKVIIESEPGKYLVSESGFFLAKVNVVKQTTSTVFAGIDSGFNHLIRPMFYGSQHFIENISNPKGKERFYSVVGYICETDTFAWDRKITEIREGDVLVFRNAGAYGFEMSSNFNSRLKPAEVLFLDGKAHLIRKRDEFEDLLKNQIEVL